MYKPNLFVIVEGQTETRALESFLSAHLYGFGLFTVFPVIGKSGSAKGGYKSFEVFLRMVNSCAKQNPEAYITTFFDYYAFNSRWPGVQEARRSFVAPTEKANRIERAMEEKAYEILEETLWVGHFIPYVQLHEFEALLFADTEILGSYLKPLDPETDLKEKFSSIKNEFQGRCEEINDKVDTAPSKRIESLARYKKGKTSLSQAAPLLEMIGLPKVRQACPRFNAWLKKLENLDIHSKS